MDQQVLKLLAAGAVGAVSALLANRGLAVFNDAVRPIYPEELEGRMSRRAFFGVSFALSFGLVIGFGIPFSLTAPIILIHSILLGTDIIGVAFPRTKIWGAYASAAAGLLYGVGLVLGLKAIVDVFAALPVNFMGDLGKVGAPIIATFAIFPALVVAKQYGVFNGAFTLIITMAVRQGVTLYGKFGSVTLNPDGMALLTGMVIMLAFAMREKGTTNSNSQLVGIFSERIARIRKNILPLALSGGLIAMATSMRLLADDPISLKLLSEAKDQEAFLVVAARLVGFVPLVATTAIATGVYSPAGMKFVSLIGIAVTNPILAFALGAIAIVLEVFGLAGIAKLLDRFPGVKAAGDEIRSAMSQVMQIALLVGSMIAGSAIAPSFGFFFVGGFYLLNKNAKKPITDMAVGPIAVIVLGVLVNILLPLGLYKIAGK